MHIRQILRTLAALLVAATMLGAPSAAAEDGWTISGVVLDGRPGGGCVPAETWVELRGQDNMTDLRYDTSTDGTFAFSGVPNGTYDVVVPGHDLSSHGGRQTITIIDEDVTGLVFYLRYQDTRYGGPEEFDDCVNAGSGEEPSDGTETPDNDTGDDTETPDDGNGDGTETPDDGNSDGTETPDDGNGDGTETPDDGIGDGTETPDNGNGDGTETPDNGNGDGTETPDDGNGEATETPIVTPDPSNAFTLTLAQRMCTDQSFSATWTGTNITSIEFALSNSSDDWTSGWLSADPAAGAFTTAIDHHAYDKAVALVTFADGTTQEVIADVNVCVSAPVAPPVTEQPSTPQKPGAVTSLPSTGSGQTASISVVSLMAATLVVAAGGLMIRRQRG